MKLVVGVIVLISCLSAIHGASYSDCGSVAGSFTKVLVTNCNDNDARCILKRGTNATVTIEFKSNGDESEVKAVCHGKVSGLEVPFRLPNPDGCVGSGLKCPLKKETSYVYSASFPVLKIYPKVPVEVKYELKNKDNKDIACVLIPVLIQ